MAVSTSKKAKEHVDEPPTEDEREENSDEEYDIDQILDAQKGYYAPNRWAFLVSWKGYGPDDNSWVDEPDFTAKDMIEEFWRDNPQIKGNPRRPRKSGGGGASSSGGGRTSRTSKVQLTPEVEEKKPVKRKSKVEDDAMEDVVEDPPKKKTKSSSVKKKSGTPNENGWASDEESHAHMMNAMTKHMGKKSWEKIIHSIETVERSQEDDYTLLVYFTTVEGTHAITSSTILAERAPRKLIDFYENNLRWAGKKIAEDDE